MTRSRVLLRLLASFLLAAACGGGRSDTGVADSASDLVSNQPAAAKTTRRSSTAPQSVVSTIQGNVSNLQVALHPRRQPRAAAPSLLASLRGLPPFASVASAGTGFEGIHVSIDGADVHGETDASGVFSVVGRYFGPTTLRFDREEDDLHAHMLLNVPNGGSLFLRDVTLDDSTGQATAVIEDLTFDGVVLDKECLRKQIQVASRYAAGGQRYVVDLADSVVSDDSGEPRRCIQLRNDAEVLVHGLVQPDGSIGSGNVTVYDEDRTAEATSSNPDVTGSPARTPVSTPPAFPDPPAPTPGLPTQ
jgi:hypothetical protein